ncbi:MAG: hypothetical protein QOH98_1075, partial [Methylobacteriaceae bacterium]|nr:hypothetical protein [Methylobacteriaceae bacterium]
MAGPSFFNPYAHGYARVAVAAPLTRVADPAFNVERTIEMFERADQSRAALVLFPELGISNYAIDDLLLQSSLLDATETALARLIEVSIERLPVAIVGAPLRHNGRLYNCAVVVHRGRVLAVIPKVYIPNYREFYEERWFASGAVAQKDEIRVCGQFAPFGTDILLRASDLPDFVLGIEICEDVWTPIPPSTYAALAGATVLINLSASNATIGKSDWRHALCKTQSGRCLSAYLYSAAGPGESTTDLAWDGQAMIYEVGSLLVEAPRFDEAPDIVVADVDLELIQQERMRQNTFGDCVDLHRDRLDFRTVEFALEPPLKEELPLERAVARYPFVPADDARLAELCFEAFNIQAHGLRQRLQATGIDRIVIGVSGGLDSTQALLVAVTAFDQLKLPRSNILAYTLPAFATTERTKGNAWRLMRALGVSAEEIDLTPACRQMLIDIKHPFAGGEPVYDVTFENVQAGARTSVLFRLANQHRGI